MNFIFRLLLIVILWFVIHVLSVDVENFDVTFFSYSGGRSSWVDKKKHVEDDKKIMGKIFILSQFRRTSVWVQWRLMFPSSKLLFLMEPLALVKNFHFALSFLIPNIIFYPILFPLSSFLVAGNQRSTSKNRRKKKDGDEEIVHRRIEIFFGKYFLSNFIIQIGSRNGFFFHSSSLSSLVVFIRNYMFFLDFLFRNVFEPDESWVSSGVRKEIHSAGLLVLKVSKSFMIIEINLFYGNKWEKLRQYDSDGIFIRG